MELLDTIDTNLYVLTFIDIDHNKAQLCWNEIKNNKSLLEEAIKVKKVKAGYKYTLNALTIAYYMLVDYKNVDSDVYNKLIAQIYSNEDIAKKILGNTNVLSPDRISFLNMSLLNTELKLNNAQKTFAVGEALSHYNNTANKYGIKYAILSNLSWNEKEKRELSYLFWKDEKSYEEVLNNWEWDIINKINSNSNNVIITEQENIYDYSKDKLFEICNNKELVYELLSDIEICKMMHKIRPLESEIQIKEEKEVKEFNIHKNVRVKLTDFGRYILGQKKYYDDLKADDEGYTEFSLSELMYIFGSHMFNGNDDLFDKNIYIYENDLKNKGNSKKLVK